MVGIFRRTVNRVSSEFTKVSLFYTYLFFISPPSLLINLKFFFRHYIINLFNGPVSLDYYPLYFIFTEEPRDL